MRRKLVMVSGSGGEHCSKKAWKIGYDCGFELAKAGFIVIQGSRDGVMEAAAKGCRDAGGLSIGISPSADEKEARANRMNDYSDVVIFTGIGFARNQILCYSADAILTVGGGIGSWHEASLGYYRKIPVVAILGSGGIADQIAGKHLDERKLGKILSAKNAKDAVAIVRRLFGESDESKSPVNGKIQRSSRRSKKTKNKRRNPI